MPLIDLLAKMRSARLHMSMVVDEYGGIDGLATIEDLVEPIVGEIWDEHDSSEEPMLIERAGGVIEASARTPVEMLENCADERRLCNRRDDAHWPGAARTDSQVDREHPAKSLHPGHGSGG